MSCPPTAAAKHPIHSLSHQLFTVPSNLPADQQRPVSSRGDYKGRGEDGERGEVPVVGEVERRGRGFETRMRRMGPTSITSGDGGGALARDDSLSRFVNGSTLGGLSSNWDGMEEGGGNNYFTGGACPRSSIGSSYFSSNSWASEFASQAPNDMENDASPYYNPEFESHLARRSLSNSPESHFRRHPFTTSESISSSVPSPIIDSGEEKLRFTLPDLLFSLSRTRNSNRMDGSNPDGGFGFSFASSSCPTPTLEDEANAWDMISSSSLSEDDVSSSLFSTSSSSSYMTTPNTNTNMSSTANSSKSPSRERPQPINSFVNSSFQVGRRETEGGMGMEMRKAENGRKPSNVAIAQSSLDSLSASAFTSSPSSNPTFTTTPLSLSLTITHTPPLHSAWDFERLFSRRRRWFGGVRIPAEMFPSSEEEGWEGEDAEGRAGDGDGDGDVEDDRKGREIVSGGNEKEELCHRAVMAHLSHAERARRKKQRSESRSIQSVSHPPPSGRPQHTRDHQGFEEIPGLSSLGFMSRGDEREIEMEREKAREVYRVLRSRAMTRLGMVVGHLEMNKDAGDMVDKDQLIDE